MNKYIDIDKLIAKIETRRDEALERQKNLERIGQVTAVNEMIANELDRLLKYVDSLQQDKETLELCSIIWWEEQGWIMIPPDATIEGIDSLLKQVRKKLQQEQPEVDLDEEIYFWIEGGGLIYPMSNKEKNNIKDTARHFYELGYNARKEK